MSRNRSRSYNILLRFFRMEAVGGAFLFVAAILAIVMANWPSMSEKYEAFLHAKVGLIIDKHEFILSLSHFVNDGLMAIFFLLVGLEIKRELLTGELSSRSRALLPAIAALGGMAMPALIYSFFNWSDATAMRGWAIPTATDIAFSLGVLALLGSRAPISMKIFLTAVAVMDDLGAIAIIAVFYTEKLATMPLLLSFLVLLFMFLLNRSGVKTRPPYMLAGLLLWVCVLQSGVHATLAGVATAFFVPLHSGEEGEPSPLVQLEHDLHFFVTFIILPVFAFTNAGVNFSGMSPTALLHSIPLGITLGLLFGKIIGISGATWAAVRWAGCEKPRDCSWMAMFGVAAICGIGFTVSLFIGNLAFSTVSGELINLVKIGVLCGSIIAGTVGFLILRFAAYR